MACSACGQSLRAFADDSTMHGFKELYHAKSVFWKFLWLVLIAGASGLTCYQVYRTIRQAAEQPTTTVIEPLTDQPARYPSLKICYLHWMYWINWTRAAELGFSKKATLWAMSYLTTIVTFDHFSVNDSRAQFVELMQINGFNHLLQFYDAVSSHTPPGFTLVNLAWDKWQKFIDPARGRLCYVASNEMIQEALSTLAHIATDYKSSIQLNYEPNYFVLNTKYMPPQEYVIYLSAYVQSMLGHRLPDEMPIKLDEFKAAPVLNVDNVRINFIMPAKETFQSQVKITGTLFKWMNSEKRPCSDKPATILYDYCDKFCYWKEIMNKYPKDCLDIAGSVLFGLDLVDRLCNHDFVFITNISKTVIPGNSPITPRPQLPTASYNACLIQYCTTPCEEWKFASTVSSLPVPIEFAFLGFPTLLYVEYPLPTDILTMTEVEAQTWETLMGNLGGIVGLWLGGSVMSIFQMLYLCCCRTCDQKLSEECRSQKIDSSRQPISVVNLDHYRYVRDPCHPKHFVYYG